MFPGLLAPFWEKRARQMTGNPVIDNLFLTQKGTGYPQTIFSMSHPLHGRGNAHRERYPDFRRETMLYPSIRFRGPGHESGPGLQRLSPYRAYMEAMRKRDFRVLPTGDAARRYAMNLSNSIRRDR